MKYLKSVILIQTFQGKMCVFSEIHWQWNQCPKMSFKVSQWIKKSRCCTSQAFQQEEPGVGERGRWVHVPHSYSNFFTLIIQLGFFIGDIISWHFCWCTYFLNSNKRMHQVRTALTTFEIETLYNWIFYLCLN